MFKVFALLVISMSAGALLLSSLEPSREDSAATPVVLLHARGQEAPTPAPPATPWNHAMVFCDVAPNRNLLPIINKSEVRPAHMRISTDGLLRVQPAWYRQEVWPEDPHALRIRIELSPHVNRVSSVQLKTLDALLQRLEAQLGLAVRGTRFESYHPRIEDLGAHLDAARRQLAALSRIHGTRAD